MKCALCKHNNPDKKNTHFLSDSIIRTCLNENGENIREKGFYFDISNESPFVEFNFQRRTTVEKLTTTLGREPNNEEIEKAKMIPFSVDFVFCSDCEKKFTDIEENFTQKYLSDFRANRYIKNVSFDDYKIIKSFFILQIWRTSVCDEIFQINSEVAEKLRLSILNNNEVDPDTLNEFPICVTYLATENNEGGATANFVGYTDDKSPNVIIMNDFIIQFFSDAESIKFFDFYGLNNKEDYHEFINTKSDKFIIKILSNEQRQHFLKDFITKDKIIELSKFYSENFERLWYALFGNYPSNYLTHQYLVHLTQGSDKNLLHYTKENIFKMTSQFIANQLK